MQHDFHSLALTRRMFAFFFIIFHVLFFFLFEGLFRQFHSMLMMMMMMIFFLSFVVVFQLLCISISQSHLSSRSSSVHCTHIVHAEWEIHNIIQKWRRNIKKKNYFAVSSSYDANGKRDATNYLPMLCDAIMVFVALPLICMGMRDQWIWNHNK